MKRVSSFLTACSVAMICMAVAADAQSKTDAKENEPKKRGWLGSVADSVKEGAREGLREGTKTSSNSADNAAAEPEPIAGPKPGVEDTELAGLFSRFPRRETVQTRGEVGWPRVAITLTSAPKWHLDHPNQYGKIGSRLPDAGCFQFKARIWDSPTEFRDIPPFYQCGLIRTQEAIGFQVWSGVLDQRSAPSGESTGLVRNEGPVPPDSPFPNSVPYRRAGFPGSWSGRALHMIIDATRIDYRQRDRRLWVIVAPELEPEGAAAANAGAAATANEQTAAESGKALPPGYVMSPKPCPSPMPPAFTKRGWQCVDGKIAMPDPLAAPAK